MTLNLFQDEVQVWQVSLARTIDEVQAFSRLLTPDEQTRADRFHFQQHRDRFIVGRGALRVLLGQYLDQPPDRLKFAYNAQGKPSLSDQGNELSNQPSDTIQSNTLQFNMAHSGDLALVAIAHHPVGIDLEQLRPMLDAIQLAQRFFSPREHAALSQLPEPAQSPAFFRYWTCKEAFLKAIGSGLTYGLDQVEIDLTGATAHLKILNDSSAQPWTLWEIPSIAGYTAACIVAGSDRQLRMMTLPD